MENNINQVIENRDKSNNNSDELKDQYANIIRDLHEHENVLLNMRFSWFSTLQGLLFAGLGFTWKDKDLPIICIMGIMSIIVAISFISVVQVGREAQRNISLWWEQNLKDYKGPPQKGIIISPQMTFTRFFRPWRILP
jgi:hypothetical protein